MRLIDNMECGYNSKRMILAQKAAQVLGLKPFSPLLYEVAVKKSDLPEKIVPSGAAAMRMQEQSLLSMGLVYRYGGSISVVDVTGHTYIMPDHPLILEELKRCGYCICKYGDRFPEDIPSELTKPYTDGRNPELMMALREYREKYTLPDFLVDEITSLEMGRGMSLETVGDYEYDVFSTNLVAQTNYGSPGELLIILQALGAESNETRKYLNACGSYGRRSEELDLISDLSLLITHYRSGVILNDELYYAENGMYSNFKDVGKKPAGVARGAVNPDDY